MILLTSVPWSSVQCQIRWALRNGWAADIPWAALRQRISRATGVFLQVYILHYNDVIMGAMASQITSLTSVHSTVYSRRRSKKHQSSALLAFVRGIHRWPVNCLHKGPVTWKMFPFDDVIMVHWYTAVPVCSPWYSRQTLHGSQMRSNYWISFVRPKSYLCIAFVSVLLYEISGYILDSVITELCYIMK